MDTRWPACLGLALLAILAGCGASQPAAPTQRPVAAATSTPAPTAAAAATSTLVPSAAATPIFASPMLRPSPDSTPTPPPVEQPVIATPTLPAQPATRVPSPASPTPPPPAPASPTSPATPPPPAPASAAQLARQDLARRLGLAVAAIEVLAEEREPLPIDVLRCDKRDKGPRPSAQPPALIPMTRVVLRAEGARYTYYVHGGRAVSCDVR